MKNKNLCKRIPKPKGRECAHFLKKRKSFTLFIVDLSAILGKSETKMFFSLSVHKIQKKMMQLVQSALQLGKARQNICMKFLHSTNSGLSSSVFIS